MPIAIETERIIIDNKLSIEESKKCYGSSKVRKGYFIKGLNFENIVISKEKNCTFIYFK